MHGNYVVKYAILCINHVSQPQTISLFHKTTCGDVIDTQYCIFYHIIPMHLVNKYMIFTHLLYIFTGSHSNGEKAQ